MVVYTLIRVVFWSVLLWRVATRPVYSTNTQQDAFHKDYERGIFIYNFVNVYKAVSSC
jgi:hypothetical protein